MQDSCLQQLLLERLPTIPQDDWPPERLQERPQHFTDSSLEPPDLDLAVDLLLIALQNGQLLEEDSPNNVHLAYLEASEVCGHSKSPGPSSRHPMALLKEL